MSTYYQQNKEHMKEGHKKWLQKDNTEKRLVWTNVFREKHGTYHNMSGKEYKLALMAWSRIVKKRDEYKCLDCNSIENLHAHHVLPKSEYPEFTFIPANDITECNDCHWNIHGGQN